MNDLNCLRCWVYSQAPVILAGICTVFDHRYAFLSETFYVTRTWNHSFLSAWPIDLVGVLVMHCLRVHNNTCIVLRLFGERLIDRSLRRQSKAAIGCECYAGEYSLSSALKLTPSIVLSRDSSGCYSAESLRNDRMHVLLGNKCHLFPFNGRKTPPMVNNGGGFFGRRHKSRRKH